MNFNLKKIVLLFTIFIYGLSFASTPQSVNVIKFGEANTLFVGDSKSGIIYAYAVTNQANSNSQKAYNIHDLSNKIAAFLKLAFWI
jgi:hypothetical protein